MTPNRRASTDIEIAGVFAEPSLNPKALPLRVGIVEPCGQMGPRLPNTAEPSYAADRGWLDRIKQAYIQAQPGDDRHACAQRGQQEY